MTSRFKYLNGGNIPTGISNSSADAGNTPAAAAQAHILKWIDEALDNRRGPPGIPGEPGVAGRDGENCRCIVAKDGCDGISIKGDKGDKGDSGSFDSSHVDTFEINLMKPDGFNFMNGIDKKLNLSAKEITKDRIIDFPDDDGVVQLQDRPIDIGDQSLIAGSADLNSLKLRGNDSTSGIFSSNAFNNLGGIYFAAKTGDLNFRGGSSENEWKIYDRNNIVQFSVRNSNENENIEYNSEINTGKLICHRQGLFSSFELGTNELGVIHSSEISSDCNFIYKISPNKFDPLESELKFVLGDINSGLIRNNSELKIFNNNSIKLSCISDDISSNNNKIYTDNNILDENGDAKIKNTLSVGRSINVTSESFGSRIRGGFVVSGNAIPETTLSSANIHIGSNTTAGIIQTINNKNTFETPLQLNPCGGSVQTKHNQIDDGEGNTNISGNLIIKNLKANPSRICYASITGINNNKAVFGTVFAQRGQFSISNSTILFTENISKQIIFDVSVSITGSISPNSSYKINSSRQINSSSMVESLTLYWRGISTSNEFIVSVEGFSVIQDGMIIIEEIVI